MLDDATTSKWARRRSPRPESTPPSSDVSTASCQETVSSQPVACLSNATTSTVSCTSSQPDLTSGDARYRPQLLISAASNRPFMSLPLFIPDGSIQQNCPISYPQPREGPTTLPSVHDLAPPLVTTTQATTSSSASTAAVGVPSTVCQSSRITTPAYSNSTLSTSTSPDITAGTWAGDFEDKDSSVKALFSEKSSPSISIRGRELVSRSPELLEKSQTITKSNPAEETSKRSGLHSSPDLEYTTEKAFALSTPHSPSHSPSHSPPDLAYTAKRTIRLSEPTLSNESNTGRLPPSDHSNDTPPINSRITMATQNVNDRGQRDSGTSRSNSTTNPYLNFVKQHDPENTLDDGRSYVGRASHYVDKPLGPPSRTNPPPSAPKQTPTSPVSNPAPSRELRQGDNKQTPQPAQRFTPGSRASPKQQSGRYADRDLTKSRWSGQALATSNTLPASFFSTAKPLAATAASSSDMPRAEHDVHFTSPSQVHASAVSQRYIPSNVQTRRQTGSTMADIYRSSNASTEGDPRLTQSSMAQSQPGMDKRQDTSRSNNWQGSAGAGWGDVTSTSFTDRAESIGGRGYSDDEDGPDGEGGADGDRMAANTSSTSILSSVISREYRVPPHDSGRSNVPQMSRTYQQDEQYLGDPLFLQYPIGDGCHMVLAMYVEKDAQSASRRFQNIERARQESSNRTKTLDEVAAIFREALEDEKKNVMG